VHEKQREEKETRIESNRMEWNRVEGNPTQLKKDVCVLWGWSGVTGHLNEMLVNLIEPTGPSS